MFGVWRRQKWDMYEGKCIEYTFCGTVLVYVCNQRLFKCHTPRLCSGSRRQKPICMQHVSINRLVCRRVSVLKLSLMGRVITFRSWYVLRRCLFQKRNGKEATKRASSTFPGCIISISLLWKLQFYMHRLCNLQPLQITHSNTRAENKNLSRKSDLTCTVLNTLLDILPKGNACVCVCACWGGKWEEVQREQDSEAK